MRNARKLVASKTQKSNNLTRGSMMSLHVNVIAGQRLMERWHMSQAELLLMMLNHKLPTVHRERHEKEWIEDYEDDLMRMLIQDKQGISSLTFQLHEILELEKKYPELASRSRKGMSGKDLMMRWDIADAELLDIVADHRLGATDPVGVPLGFSEIEQLLSTGCINESDLLFKVDDVERFEKEHGIKPTDKAIGMPKKPKHDALCKQRCREIAQKIWKKDPTITIHAIGEMEEILAVTKRQDGDLYAEKTIRKWIKDLNPNKGRHGRPKKQ